MQGTKKIFWILTPLITIASLFVWFRASGKLTSERKANTSSIVSKFSGLDSIKSTNPTHPNEVSHEKMQELIDGLKEDLKEAWELQYERQRGVLIWSDELGDEIVGNLSAKIPIEWKVPYPGQAPGEKQQLEALTYDFFQPGEMQPERDHSFTGDSIYVIDFRNRKGRVANRGGWFGVEMKVKPKFAMDLTVEYWGGFTGSKTFDIVVDDQVIATENISGKADGQFIQVTYSIPEGLTQDKEKVQVDFKPHIGNRAGPIFGVRTVERKK